ncbi:hypothetical protein FHX74_002677 [Friedmanniella endophytica]|uniref:DUF1345 domain-containing protein n=1 Tax=Microlunatus kandeliicorticis TaxID=1759536 RepID=A0A7W3ITP9_9ACTN|nr:hypothetical protein [Microlunatus kandeliicorticis]MBA8795049.1 hypothetical protein [Microlunatus kandeliicorticis]
MRAPGESGRAGRRADGRGENRIPPVTAVVVAIAVYALLPQPLLFAPRFIVPAVELVLLVAMMITNPRREVERSRWSRRASLALAAVLIVTNLSALGLLLHALLQPRTGGAPLLIGAAQVWLTNVIGFSLLYWELDRGGPVARRSIARASLPPADWRFSQDENDDNVVEVARTSSARSDWIPVYVDYLYLSVTNSSAFSPTDTMPLSSRAKALMALQATTALFVTLILIARAVGSLGGG